MEGTTITLNHDSVQEIATNGKVFIITRIRFTPRYTKRTELKIIRIIKFVDTETSNSDTLSLMRFITDKHPEGYNDILFDENQKPTIEGCQKVSLKMEPNNPTELQYHVTYELMDSTSGFH